MRMRQNDKPYITEKDVASHIWAICEPPDLAGIINEFARLTHEHADSYSEMDDVGKWIAENLDGKGRNLIEAIVAAIGGKE